MMATPRTERKVYSTVGLCLPAGIFNRNPEAIAASLASKEVSPQGPASGMRVLSFYLSHAGKVLSASRRRNLEKARKLLAARVEQALKVEQRLKIENGARSVSVGWK
jgi:tRNA(adenine34) deaminase